MRLKSFYAKTMTEAMQMVRDTLGEDAIIVATREEKGGKAVHITAAVEPAFELGRGGAAGTSDWLQYDAEENENAIAEELTDTLLRHAATEDVMDHIISCATVIGMDRPGPALVASLEHLFSFRPLPRTASKKPLILAGSPGSGKTLAVAKLAARNVLGGLKVGVITTDTVRAGGIEQLEAFTRLLRLPLRKATTPEEVRTALAEMKGMDQILIDTSSTNHFDLNDMKALARLIAQTDGDAILTLPAGINAEESGDMARAYAAVGVHSLMATRLDAARRFGGLLSAAQQGRLSITEAGNTPKVAEGLMAMTPDSLARLLMPAAFARSGTNAGTSATNPGKSAIRTGTRQ